MSAPDDDVKFDTVKLDNKLGSTHSSPDQKADTQLQLATPIPDLDMAEDEPCNTLKQSSLSDNTPKEARESISEEQKGSSEEVSVEEQALSDKKEPGVGELVKSLKRVLKAEKGSSPSNETTEEKVNSIPKIKLRRTEVLKDPVQSGEEKPLLSDDQSDSYTSISGSQSQSHDSVSLSLYLKGKGSASDSEVSSDSSQDQSMPLNLSSEQDDASHDREIESTDDEVARFQGDDDEEEEEELIELLSSEYQGSEEIRRAIHAEIQAAFGINRIQMELLNYSRDMLPNRELPNVEVISSEDESSDEEPEAKKTKLGEDQTKPEEPAEEAEEEDETEVLPIQSDDEDEEKLNDWLDSEFTSGVMLTREEWEFYEDVGQSLRHRILHTLPFKHVVIDNFFTNNSTNDLCKLVKSCLKLKFTKKAIDLYENHQSKDLAIVKLRTIQMFLKFLKKRMMPKLREITGLDLVNVSANCSSYRKGDYLLCHDDRIGKRSIAFIYYLPIDKRWVPSMGGELRLFGTDIEGQPTFKAKSLLPIFNRMVLFKVSDISFHEVGENISDCNRLSINGWFHSKEKEEYEEVKFQMPLEGLNSAVGYTAVVRGIRLEHWINSRYISYEAYRAFQRRPNKDTVFCIPNFLVKARYTSLVRALDEATWELVGPANVRKYDVLDNFSLPAEIANFHNFILSEDFFCFLTEVTSFNLRPTCLKNAVTKPACRFEYQRWMPGCYELLADCVESTRYERLDVLLYLGSDDKILGGNTQYIDTTGRSESPSVNITPISNSLNIIETTDAALTRYVPRLNQRAGAYFYIIKLVFTHNEPRYYPATPCSSK